jgi:nicotinamidase-related amidase
MVGKEPSLSTMIQFDSTPALIVVDMQNGFCHKDGSFARLGIQTDPTTIVVRINELLSEFRVTGLPIYFLKTGYKADYSDRRGRDRHDRLKEFQGLLRGSWDADILDKLTPGLDDHVIDETRNSCLFRTSLEDTLRERAVDHLILTGVGIDVCAKTTVRDAFQLSFAVTTISDTTWTCNESDHLAALQGLRDFGDTASTSEVTEALKKLRKSNHVWQQELGLSVHVVARWPSCWRI